MTPLESLIDTFQDDVKEICDALAAGEAGGKPYGVDEFQDDMARSLAEFHTAAFMAGQGRTKLNAKFIPLLTGIVEEQLRYLEQFGEQIDADGWQEKFRARADMYTRSIKISFSAGQTKGLPLPGYPAQGTECRTNCGCRWWIDTIDEEAGDFDAYWERNADDSCDTCVKREREWSPVRIRGGELED